MKRPIIFDCDGTLVDSEPVHARANVAILARYGVHLTQEEALRRHTGLTLAGILADANTLAASPLPDHVLTAIRDEGAALMQTDLRPMAGAAALLTQLRQENHPIAVATNSDSLCVQRNLRLTGLADFFGPAVASAQQVARPKPAPDVYLYAATLLDIAPHLCLAVEDSVPGVHAARAAGMTVLGLAHHSDSAQLLQAGAHAIVTRLADLTDWLDYWPTHQP